MNPKPNIRFVKNYTPLDFQAKNLTPFILPRLNSFDEKTLSENGEIYTGSDGSDKYHLCPELA